MRAILDIDERGPRETDLASLLRDSGATTGGGPAAITARRCGLRVSVPHNPSVEMLTGEDGHAERQVREVTTDSGRLAVPTVSGLGVPDSAPAAGPVFLQAPDTTIFVPGGWSVSFSRQGYGILVKES